ncbi:MAG: CPBP family intramembrane glutamic endopeptidase [Bryobacterales bacterium]|nr:CPBP family intramembrane metalloprotease [Bryobacteraceae bacterium]MDW8128964.1 CPBP family intramembrane glutamic endopeptidase [Bryobacterales bacterium]
MRRMERDTPEPDRAALIEALSVFGLILTYIWKIRLFHPWRWIWIAAIVVLSHTIRREGAAALGLGAGQLRTAFAALAPWVGLLAAILLAGGALLDTINPVVLRRAPGSLAVYLVWGLLQQWILNGYFLNRLRQAGGGRRAPFLAALLFSLAHLPNPFLMALTLPGGYLAARLFLRYRSLWLLGAAHGLLGFLLNLVVPDPVSGRFLVGPRYILHQFGTYPEALI